jgi:hypothetical protein
MTMQYPMRLSQLTPVAALVFWLSASGSGFAQSATPFVGVEGHWSGSGSIQTSDGGKEQIRCRASYDLLKQGKNLQLNIRCASDSFNFDLRGSASYAAGKITGSWSESTRNASGDISGTASDGKFQVIAKGAFSARLTVATKGDKQTVDIKSLDPDASLKGASIALRRTGG